MVVAPSTVAPMSHQIRGRTGLCQAKLWKEKEEFLVPLQCSSPSPPQLKPLILSALWVAGGWRKTDTTCAAIPVCSLGKVKQQTKGGEEGLCPKVPPISGLLPTNGT